MKKKIVIIGGGISGLATAFFIKEKNKNIDVHLYEKQSYLGGYARSVKSNNVYTEHSPRVIAIKYTNFFKIINCVPEIKKHVKVTKKTKDIGFHPKKSDLFILFLILIFYIVTNRKTRKKFESVIYEKKSFDKETKNFIDVYLHKLGKDHNDISFDVVVNLCKVFLQSIFDLNVHHFDGPFEHVFIQPLLQHMNINVYLNNELTYIKYNCSTSKIDYILINGNEIVHADQYILALDINALHKFYKLPKIDVLKTKSYGIHMGCLLVFNKKIETDLQFITLNTEWKPIIQLRENCWEDMNASQWSIALPNLYTEKNKISHMNTDQILKELIKQISIFFSGVSLCDITYFRIWEAFYKDDNNIWQTSEPYFVDFINIDKYRHGIKTAFSNLFLVNAFSSDIKYPIWYKEAAAECAFRFSQLYI